MLYHRNSLNYWIEIVLRRGVLGLEFLRGRSAEEIMSRVIEFSDHDARPLVKVYSRREARELFGMFKDVRVEVEQLMRDELRFFSPLVSEFMFERLRKTIGWNVIVTRNEVVFHAKAQRQQRAQRKKLAAFASFAPLRETFS